MWSVVSLYAKGLTTGEIQAHLAESYDVDVSRDLISRVTDKIRRVVYTTNAIESLNARFRQATRRRGHFPNDQAALKVLYLVIRNPRPNRANVTGKTTGWKTALNALALYYSERITRD